MFRIKPKQFNNSNECCKQELNKLNPGATYLPLYFTELRGTHREHEIVSWFESFASD